MKKRGMVFGVFDRFHVGHEFFLSNAAQKCDELVVVVTLPEIVAQLKGKLSLNDLATRISKIQNFNPHLSVVSGDKKLGSWEVLKTYQPNIILLGCDQQGIAAELDRLDLPYEFLPHLQR